MPVDGVDLKHLKGTIAGPPDTPYAGGTFIIDIQIPDNYPFKSPTMRFDTKIWHPNVSSQTVSFLASSHPTAFLCHCRLKSYSSSPFPLAVDSVVDPKQC